MDTIVSEILWLRWLLSEINVVQDAPTQIFSDNQDARQIANNPVFHERTKHVEMGLLFCLRAS